MLYLKKRITMDSTISLDFSRSIDQLCNQLSISHIVVPKIDTYKNIFEFISEFEMVTAMLPDNQRVKLLVKAFPAGRHMAWYEDMIKSLASNASWKNIKPKIIERYSDTEDRDRHLRRLDTIKFNPEGSVKLFDYVEEIIYSFSKAFPKEGTDTKLRYIKSKLPSKTLLTLSTIPDFISATSIEDFMKGIRLFDTLKAGSDVTEDSSNEKLKVNELFTVIKDLIEGIKQQAATKVVSALTPRSGSPADSRRGEMITHPNMRREESPGRNNYRRYQERSPSPYGRNYQRSPSPARHSNGPNYNNQNYRNDEQYYNRNMERNYHQNRYNRPNNYPDNNHYNTDNPPTNNTQVTSYERGRSPPPRNFYQNRYPMENNFNPSSYNRPSRRMMYQENKPNIAFDSDRYYQRFGYPTQPCPNCEAMHWVRHCPETLN